MSVQLLLEHLDAISPDSNDLLHELLQDLGDVPDREALLGTVMENKSPPHVFILLNTGCDVFNNVSTTLYFR